MTLLAIKLQPDMTRVRGVAIFDEASPRVQQKVLDRLSPWIVFQILARISDENYWKRQNMHYWIPLAKPQR